jgi:hypothetical protein
MIKEEREEKLEGCSVAPLEAMGKVRNTDIE